MLFYKRLLSEHIGFINVKVGVILWGITYFLYPPTPLVNELGYSLVYSGAACVIFGSIMGIIGLVLSNIDNVKRTYQGILIEFSGLVITTCGSLSYFITGLYLLLKYDQVLYWSHIMLAYAVFSALLSRCIVVLRGVRAGSD